MTRRDDHDDLSELDRQLFDALKSEDGAERADDQTGGLAAAFDALRVQSASKGQTVDVHTAIMAKVRPPQGLLISMMRWAPLAASIVAVLFIGQQFLAAETLRIDAPHGVMLFGDGHWTAARGEIEFQGKREIKTLEHAATVKAPNYTARLHSHSEMVAAAEQIELSAGRTDLYLRNRTAVQLPLVNVKMRGRFGVGLLEEQQMLKNKRNLRIFGGAVAIVAIYAGYLHVAGGKTVDKIVGPAGAAVDEKGNVRPLSLANAERALLDDQTPSIRVRDGVASGKMQATGEVQEKKKPTTGGYWDAKAKTIRFILAGEVFDAVTGDPIEDFEIALEGSKLRSFDTESSRTTAFTGKKNGNFLLPNLGLGNWRLIVSSKGYAPSKQTVALDKVTSDPWVVVPLSVGGRLSGVVRDWRHQPLEGVKISLGGCVAKARCPKATTDRKGTFVLAGAPEERPFTIYADDARYGHTSLPNLQLTEGESQHVEITLSGVLKVSGQVLRGEKRSPAVGVTVTAGEVTATTDAAGLYQLKMPLARSPHVRVVTGDDQYPSEFASYPKGRSAEPIQWVDGDDHVAILRKDFLLSQETASLSGRITRAGKPLANTTIYLHNTMGWNPSKRGHETFPEKTVTDGLGRYRIADVPAYAGYWFYLRENGVRAELGRVIIEKATDIVANFDLDAGTITGVFRDQNNASPFALDRNSCARFGAQREGDGAVYPARCLSDGGFEIRNLPQGRYRLALIAPKLFSDVQIEPIEVTLDKSLTRRDVEVLVKGKQRTYCKARVTDLDGGFVASLILRYHRGKNTRTESLRVRDDGTVSFSVPKEQVEIFIDAPGYVPAQLDLSKDVCGGQRVVDVQMAKSQLK